MAVQENYVKIPKDLSLIKQKFIMGLTKRQAICFGIGLIMGIPAFFITKALVNNLTIAVCALGIFAFPGIACGIYNKNGMYLEEYIPRLYKFIKKNKTKTYQSLSATQIIENQIEYNQLKQKLLSAGVSISEFNDKKVTIFDKLRKSKK